MTLRFQIRRRSARPSLLAAGVLALLLGLAGPQRASAAVTDYAGTFYLSSTPSALVTSSHQLVQTAPASAVTTTQNRIATSITGYQEFQAGVKPALPSSNTPSPVVASASTTPTNKGWIVDGAGGLSFTAGTWTFTNTVLQNYTSGSAQIVVGMWKVTVASNAVSTPTLLVDPNCAASPCSSGAAPGSAASGASNFITSSGSSTQTLNVALSAISLASNEHLYVQFWRWQTTAMPATAGAANRLATLMENDGVAKITHPSTMPTAALGSVPARTNAPSLTATYADDAFHRNGTVKQQLCTDSACSSVVTSSTSATLAPDASTTWSPSGLISGTTYYWNAQSTDSNGGTSPWTATTSFVYDTTPPDVPTLVTPADGLRTAPPPTLDARYTEAEGSGGSITLELCRAANCTTTTVSSVVSGSDATWAVAPLSEGSYTWRARATDTPGNASAWSASRTFTVDITPPTVALSAPPARTNAAPLLRVHLSSPDDPSDTARALFELCADAACTSVVSSGWTAPGADVAWQAPTLADGTYSWRALGEDAVGNQSAWVGGSEFAVDTVAPASPSLSGPAAAVNRVALTASIPGDATDRGRVEFQVCADRACGDVVASTAAGAEADGSASWTPTLPADGTYAWRARSIDLAGNASDWSDTSSFTLDRTPPGAPQAARATVAHQTLTLRWSPPKSAGAIVRYVLLVNGRPVKALAPTTRVIQIKLKPHDRRKFAVAAVDSAGNVGTPAPPVTPQRLTVKRAK